MHFAQALTLLPDVNFTHCKLGYFLFLMVGLYLPRSFFNFQTSIDPFPQIAHCLAIYLILSKFHFFSSYVILKYIMELLFQIIVLIFSIVIHEVSHGAMANYLGDPTAKYAGRLTLNPLKHLDPIGSVLVPFFLIFLTGRGIGWAKPVPINPYNFRDQKYGSFKVALAGPGANLLLALIFGLILRFSPLLGFLPNVLYSAFSFIVLINMLLAIFNLIPIPPLDGSHILFTFLPDSMQKIKIFLSQFGIFILLFLIFLFPWFFSFLFYIVSWVFILIVGSPLSY